MRKLSLSILGAAIMLLSGCGGPAHLRGLSLAGELENETKLDGLALFKIRRGIGILPFGHVPVYLKNIRETAFMVPSRSGSELVHVVYESASRERVVIEKLSDGTTTTFQRPDFLRFEAFDPSGGFVLQESFSTTNEIKLWWVRSYLDSPKYVGLASRTGDFPAKGRSEFDNEVAVDISRTGVIVFDHANKIAIYSGGALSRTDGHTPSISPDGQTIVSLDREHGPHVSRLDRRQVIDFPRGLTFDGPSRFSPNGKYVSVLERHGWILSRLLGPRYRHVIYRLRDMASYEVSRENSGIAPPLSFDWILDYKHCCEGFALSAGFD